jgi:hypothetical protein
VYRTHRTKTTAIGSDGHTMPRVTSDAVGHARLRMLIGLLRWSDRQAVDMQATNCVNLALKGTIAGRR